MKTDAIQDALATVKNARIALQKQIDDALSSERTSRAQIDAYRAMPISLNDWSQYLKKHIENLGREWFAARRATVLLIDKTYDTAMNKRSWNTFEREVGEVTTYSFAMPDFCALNGGDAFGALCFVLPEAVHEKLMAGYRSAIGAKWGNEDHPPVENRRKIIADLKEKISASQAHREGLEESLSALSVGVSGAANTNAPDTANSAPGAVEPLRAGNPFKGQRLANPDLAQS